MAIILDGKNLSERILAKLKEEVQKSDQKLQLVGILVGSSPDSKVFLAQKEKACKKVGIDFQLYQFLGDIAHKTLAEKVKEICRKENHGIIIQLPLPKHINTQEILNLIPPGKDIDALSEETLVSSPVLKGILNLFQEYKIGIKGKKVVVVGRGRLVGKPVVSWFEKHGAEIIENTKEADILISGAGKPGLIKGDMVKRGVVVVDAANDVDFKSVSPKASFITPSIGGIGPMTVAMVLENLIFLSQKK